MLSLHRRLSWGNPLIDQIRARRRCTGADCRGAGGRPPPRVRGRPGPHAASSHHAFCDKLTRFNRGGRSRPRSCLNQWWEPTVIPPARSNHKACGRTVALKVDRSFAIPTIAKLPKKHGIHERNKHEHRHSSHLHPARLVAVSAKDETGRNGLTKPATEASAQPNQHCLPGRGQSASQQLESGAPARKSQRRPRSVRTSSWPCPSFDRLPFRSDLTLDR